VAALASIGLLTRAYEIVLADEGLPVRTRVDIVGRLAGAVGTGGLVGGQFVDLACGGPSIEPPTLDYIHTHKTAGLFVVAGTSAAAVGDASVEQVAALETYAVNLGRAFQILDDLLDAAGAVAEVGKPLRRDKANFVTLYGLDRCRELVQEYTGSAVGALGVFGGREAKLVVLARMLLKRKS
jgi:geranylgeranyl diphosphate synthase type II